MTESLSIELPPIVEPVRRAIPAGAQVWLVGGAVRDALLQHRTYDLDFAVSGDGLAVARAVARALSGAYYPLDSERGVGRVIAGEGEARAVLDFAQLRGEDLAADLALRDFTFNAMAVDLARPEVLVDPLGGQADLRAHIIRACTPASIADDPVRGIRAVRLAAQLNFRLDPATREAVRAASGALGQVSAERRRDEFVRCVTGPRPAGAMRALDALGLLPHLVPELVDLKAAPQAGQPGDDGWEHTLATLARLRDLLAVLNPVYDVDTASDLTLGLVSLRLGRHRQALAAHLQAPLAGDRPARWALMLAALLHRVADHPQLAGELAAARLAELRFSNEEARRANAIIAHYPRPAAMAHQPEVTRRAIYRYFRAAGAAGIDAVLLALASFLAGHAAGPPPTDAWNHLLDAASALLRAWFEHPEQAVDPPALVTGNDLMRELGMPAGPAIGRLLEAIREAQAAGEVADREAALAYARARL